MQSDDNQLYPIQPSAAIPTPIIEISPVQSAPGRIVDGVQTGIRNTVYNASKPTNVPPKRSSRHLFYALELLVFVVVGWGWLAMREFMSATPVLDVTVFICLLASSVINLCLALAYYTTDQFKSSAQGFFAHTLTVWVLYIYSISESTTVGQSLICCNNSDSSIKTFSVSKSYSAAYYGSLPFHQTAGAVTLAFLTVFLILAAGQLRVCLEDPREWLLRKTTTYITCLVSCHLGLFSLNSRACEVDGLGRTVIGLAISAWLLTIDVPELYFGPFDLKRGTPASDNANKVNNVTDSYDKWSLIQGISELTLILILESSAGVLSFRVGGSVSFSLMVIFAGVLLWQASAVVIGLLAMAMSRRQQMDPPEDYAPPAPSEYSVRMSNQFGRHNTRPVMILPGVREMRRNGAQGRREKKSG
jgi:hypothetical protein